VVGQSRVAVDSSGGAVRLAHESTDEKESVARLDVATYFEGPLLNRRRFLVGTGGAVNAFVLEPDTSVASASGRGEAAFSPAVTSSIAGVIERVEPPRLYLRTAEGNVAVEFRRDAVFQRDHRVLLDAFSPGDDVVVEGEWADGVYIGNALAPMLDMLESVVTNVTPDRIQTAGGVILLTRDSRYLVGDALVEEPPPYIAVGALITALGRRERNGDLVGLMICEGPT